MLISTIIQEKMCQRITTTAIITNSSTIIRTTTTLAIKIITLHINTNNSKLITTNTLTNKAEIEIKITKTLNLSMDKGISMEIILVNNSNNLSIKIMENINMPKQATITITNTTTETAITIINSTMIAKMQTINHTTDRIRGNITTIIMEIITIRMQIIQIIIITKLIQEDPSNKPITMSKLMPTIIRDNQNTTNKLLISLRTKFKMARTSQISIKDSRE